MPIFVYTFIIILYVAVQMKLYVEAACAASILGLFYLLALIMWLTVLGSYHQMKDQERGRTYRQEFYMSDQILIHNHNNLMVYCGHFMHLVKSAYLLRNMTLKNERHLFKYYRVDQKKRTPLSYIPLISLFSADFLKFSASNRQHDTSIKLWCPESVVFTIL